MLVRYAVTAGVWGSRMRAARLLQLAGRSFVIGALVVCGASAAVWVATLLFGNVGIISLGTGTDVRIWHGEAQFRHVYEYDVAPPVPSDQWFATAMSRG